MNLDKRVFNTSMYHLRVGLFDKNKRPIYSSIITKNINFSKKIYQTNETTIFIKTLKSSKESVKYIVVENLKGKDNIYEIQATIFFTIFLSSIFIAIIGYFLSKILLKPYKEKIERIDKFIKDSTHELNTPISALMMSVSALKKKKY